MHRLRIAAIPVALLAVATVVAGCGGATGTPGPTPRPLQWPVAGHDPQRTSTGPARGPIAPAPVEGFPRKGKGTAAGAPVVGQDGTLYTAIYRPAEGSVEYRWPGFAWPQSFTAFSEGMHDETLAEGSLA